MAGRVGQELFDAARNLPNYLVPKSPYYEVNLSGSMPSEVVMTVPIPLDSKPFETLSLYSWTGSGWEYIPSAVFPTEEIIEARLGFVPSNVMVMQTTPVVPAVAASLGLDSQLPQGVNVSTELVAGLYLRGDGALEGRAPINNGRTIPVIRNWEGEPTQPVVRTDLINNLLIEAGQQDNQLKAVYQTVVHPDNNYPGIAIDYRGVDALPSARADFVHLISQLAQRLHEDNRTLTVRVEAANQISAEEWDTGGYDWVALGRLVDTLIIPAPVDPMAYQPNGAMDTLMTWATSQVDRRKIQVELPGQSVERSGNYLLMKGYQQAFTPLLSRIDSSNSGDQISLSLDNDRLLSQVQWNDAIGMYYYSYQDDQGLERTVFIESSHSIKQKLMLLKKYNVRQVSLTVPATGDVDPRIWDVMLQFQQDQELAQSTGLLEVSFNVLDAAGNIVSNAVRPLDSPSYAFQPATEGELQVQATIIGEGGLALTAPKVDTIAVGNVVAVAAPDAPIEAADSGPSDAVAAAALPDYANLRADTIVNVREGPGTNYNILGQINPGETQRITGMNPAGDWWEIDFGGRSGWIINQLATAAGDLSTVAVAANIPDPPPAPPLWPPPRPRRKRPLLNQPLPPPPSAHRRLRVAAALATAFRPIWSTRAVWKIRS